MDCQELLHLNMLPHITVFQIFVYHHCNAENIPAAMYRLFMGCGDLWQYTVASISNRSSPTAVLLVILHFFKTAEVQ